MKKTKFILMSAIAVAALSSCSKLGKLTADMEIFADHSQHMVVSWAVIGPEDGAALRKLMDAYWQNPNDSNREKLLADLSKIDKSILTLHKELSPKVLKECQPQLEQFRRILQADKLGLEVLAGDQSKQAAFQQAVKEVKAHEPQVLISEKTARAFMDELQQHMEK